MKEVVIDDYLFTIRALDIDDILKLNIDVAGMVEDGICRDGQIYNMVKLIVQTGTIEPEIDDHLYDYLRTDTVSLLSREIHNYTMEINGEAISDFKNRGHHNEPRGWVV